MKKYVLAVFLISVYGQLYSAPIKPAIYTSTPVKYNIHWENIVVPNPNESRIHSISAQTAQMPLSNSAPGISAMDNYGTLWFVVGGGGFANLEFPSLGHIGALNTSEPENLYLYALADAHSLPNGIYVDNSSQRAYVSQYRANRLSWFALPDTLGGHLIVHEVDSPLPDSRPTGVYGRKDNAWFNLNKGHAVVHWDILLNQLVAIPIPTDKARPTGMIGDVSGNIWFSQMYGNKIGRLSPEGNITEFHLPQPRSKPSALSITKDGSVWFAQRGSNRLGRIKEGHYTDFQFPKDYTGPFFTSVGEGDSIWISQLYSGTVSRYLPANNALDTFAIGDGETWPGSIAVDRQGELWITNLKSNSLTRLLVIKN